jgi:hypothetical protein
MSRHSVRIAASVLLASLVGLDRQAALADEPAAAAPDFSGRWALSRTLSDDALQKLHEAMAHARGFGPGGEATGLVVGGSYSDLLDGEQLRESMQAILEPADELTVTQSGSELVFDETFGRRRSLHPDGRKYKTENGTAEVKCAWKLSRLVVETKSDRGRKLVESWELSANRSRLIVEAKIEGRILPPLLLKRVYERARSSP